MPTDEPVPSSETATAHPEGGADPYYPDDSLYPGAAGDETGGGATDAAAAGDGTAAVPGDTAHPATGADPYYPDDSLYPDSPGTAE